MTPARDPAPPDGFPDPVDDFPDPDDERLFPRLTDEQLGQVKRFAEEQRFERDEVLFEHGERGIPFFVLEDGVVDFLDRRTDGDPDGNRYFARAKTGTFIGDTAVFTGEPSIAVCVAATKCRVLAMQRSTLRDLIASVPSVGDVILQTLMARRAWMEDHAYGTAMLIGPRWSEATFRLRDFLSRNQAPFRWIDPEDDPESRALLDGLQIQDDDLPVIVAAGAVIQQPSTEAVADALGLRPDLRAPDETPYDLIVVGAGPSGLAAAVYGASEGLDTLALDADCPGGQAGLSSKIENYLGFATGISGSELTREAVLQARKFGAVLTNPRRATALRCEDDGTKTLTLEDDSQVRGHAVVLATGAEYRRLRAESIERFENAGVYYVAGAMEARQCQDEDVAIVGGGNSAGQAAMHLAEHARRVYLVCRSAPLGKSMSQYLVERVEASDAVEVLLEAEVTAVHGSERLEAMTLNGSGIAARRVPMSALFVMIGAVPRTEWLAGSGVALDANGFVPTGDAWTATGRAGRAEVEPLVSSWTVDRDPYFLETSCPGVFAVGDVRSGSIKRVASAVGEGSMAVKLVHQFLDGGGQ